MRKTTQNGNQKGGSEKTPANRRGGRSEPHQDQERLGCQPKTDAMRRGRGRPACPSKSQLIIGRGQESIFEARLFRRNLCRNYQPYGQGGCGRQHGAIPQSKPTRPFSSTGGQADSEKGKRGGNSHRNLKIDGGLENRQTENTAWNDRSLGF